MVHSRRLPSEFQIDAELRTAARILHRSQRDKWPQRQPAPDHRSGKHNRAGVCACEAEFWSSGRACMGSDGKWKDLDPPGSGRLLQPSEWAHFIAILRPGVPILYPICAEE